MRVIYLCALAPIAISLSCAHRVIPPLHLPAAGPATIPATSRVAKRSIFGDTSQAKSVVFGCDLSGSMSNKVSILIEQVTFAVQDLDASQRFDVIFFGNGKTFIFTRDMLKRPMQSVLATTENKQLALSFMGSLTIDGASIPEPGITAGLREQPELMFILTDGDFDDNQRVLRTVREENPNARTRINTIAFVDPQKDTEHEFLTLLQTIARENRGRYSYVDETKLED